MSKEAEIRELLNEADTTIIHALQSRDNIDWLRAMRIQKLVNQAIALLKEPCKDNPKIKVLDCEMTLEQVLNNILANINEVQNYECPDKGRYLKYARIYCETTLKYLKAKPSCSTCGGSGWVECSSKGFVPSNSSTQLSQPCPDCKPKDKDIEYYDAVTPKVSSEGFDIAKYKALLTTEVDKGNYQLATGLRLGLAEIEPLLTFVRNLAVSGLTNEYCTYCRGVKKSAKKLIKEENNGKEPD